MMAWYVPTSPGYPRPQAASPTRISLVPAYNQCTSPNRVHGPPDFPGNASNPDGSCNPPAQSSSQLTVGSSGRQRCGREVGRLRAGSAVLPGNPATPADEADARVTISMTDVRRRSDLTDYTGQLQLETTIRVTDRNNGPSEVGTAQDVPFRVTVPCAGTGDTDRRLDLLREHDRGRRDRRGHRSPRAKRSIWQLGQVRVNDGGPDGVVATTPNTLFAVQGSSFRSP